MSGDLDGNIVSSDAKQALKPTEDEIAINVSLDQSNTVNTSSSVARTAENDDAPRRSFSELRAMFSAGLNEQARRPSSPGLDLTPVKEQQTSTLIHHGQLTEANNNGYHSNNVLESSAQSQSLLSSNSSISDNSRTSKPTAISFEIDLEDCVTRDCVTRDSDDSLSTKVNNESNVESVTTTEQQNTVEGLKKSYSFEISFDDDVGKNSCNPPYRRTKAHQSKMKTSSPKDPSKSPRENLTNAIDSKYKPSCPKENVPISPRDNLKSNESLNLSHPPTISDESSSSNTIPSSLSFEISFDDCNSDTLSKNGDPLTSSRNESTGYQNASSNAKSSSLSFEINFDDCKRGGSPPRRDKPALSGRTPKTKMSSFANHGLDDWPEKEPRTVRATKSSSPSSTTTSVRTRLRSSPTSSSATNESSTSSSRLPSSTTKMTAPISSTTVRKTASSPSTKSSTSTTKTVSRLSPPTRTATQERAVGISNRSNEQRTEEPPASSNSPLHECRDGPHYQSLDTFPEKECSESNQDAPTSSISFDISFEDDLASTRKTKLAPKHIRLKMSKRKAENRTATNARRKEPEKDATLLASVESNSPVLDANRTAPKAENVMHEQETAPLQNVNSETTRRDTYTLDEVSQTLQEACLKGETLEQALDSLARSHDLQELKNEDGQQTSSEEINTTASKRGTYSLDEVSKCLVDAANSGHTVTQALESLSLNPEAYAKYLNDCGNLKRRKNTLNERRNDGEDLDKDSSPKTVAYVKPAHASNEDYDQDVSDGTSPKRRTWNLQPRRNKDYATDSKNKTNLKHGTVSDKRKENAKDIKHEVASKLGTIDSDGRESTDETDKEVTLKRGTYDLDDVSHKQDTIKVNGKSLEQALEQLLDEVESAGLGPRNTQSNSSTINRGTYDLEEVSVAVQNFAEQGIPVEESLDKISSHVSSETKNSEKRGTWNLDDFESKSLGEVPVIDNRTNTKRGTWNSDDLEKKSVGYMPVIDNRTSTSDTKAGDKRGTWNLDDFEDSTDSNNINASETTEKRGTYNLDDVANRLDSATEQESVVDTLSNIADSTTNESAARNTYTLDEVAHSLEVAKTKGIPIVQALSNISNSDDVSSTSSRGTYPLDEVAESIESARKKGLPIVMALENLISQDGVHKKEPESVAIHRRQGKLTNRKTYALASPLETIGEDNQLKLFDGTSRKFITMVDPMSRFYEQQVEEDENTSGKHVVKTLDLLTSACEALLRSRNRETEDQSEEAPNDSDATQVPPETEGLKSKDLTTNDSESHEVGRIESTSVESTPPAPPRKRIPRAIRKGNVTKSESNLNTSPTNDEQNRQTYSLDSVSNSVESAKAKGIPVIAALEELTNSLAQFSATGAKALKNGKKPIKKPDRPSIRKRQAARERAGVMSDVPEQAQRPKGTVFPISYPPAMRNSYSLDDVATALEMAYKTGASFEDFLYNKTDKREASNGAPSARSTGSLTQDHDQQKSKTCPTTSADSVTLNSSSSEDYLTSQARNSVKAYTAISTDSITLSSSSSEDRLDSQPRKNSSSSDGGLSYSSSNNSDLSAAKDSSMEDLAGDGSRKQRKRSAGPFQLRRKRRGSPATLTNLSASGDNSLKSAASHDSNLSSSRGSSLWGSDTSLQKRGTYDLKQVSKELDSLKQQGLPVVNALDKIGSSDNIASNRQGEDNTNTSERSKTQSVCSANKNNSNTTTSEAQDQSSLDNSPKRNTYVLEDNVNCVGTSEGTMNVPNEVTVVNKRVTTKGVFGPAPALADTGTRNTFTLDEVQNSIEDAHQQGVPVLDVLDKLSSKETPKQTELKKHIKAKFKTFTKPQTKSSDKDEFFIEFFPSKSEIKSPRHKLENDEPIDVSIVEDEQSTSAQNFRSKMPSKTTSSRDKDEFFIEFFSSKPESVSPRCHHENGVPLDVTKQFDKPKTLEQDNNTNDDKDSSTDHRTNTDVSNDDLRQPNNTTDNTQPDQLLYATKHPESRAADEKTDVYSNNESSPVERDRVTGSRPRWKHTGSYIEALELFIETEELTDKLEIDSRGSGDAEEANKPTITTSDLLDQLRDMDHTKALGIDNVKSLEQFPEPNQDRSNDPTIYTTECANQLTTTNNPTIDTSHSFEQLHTFKNPACETANETTENDQSAYSDAESTTLTNQQTNRTRGCELEAGYSYTNGPGTRPESNDTPVPSLPTNKQKVETPDIENIALNESGVDTADSNYTEESYDAMATESSPRSRWRPSGSVLSQILSLMDNAEEQGLSIADALEQAAELSERQGEIEESKDDDVIPETGHPQHLALLSLHFEEKRRQIEAEKLRSNEKWEQQRRQLDETAFWYTIGRGQSVAKDVGNARLGQEKAGECSSPGLPTPPIGRSTPFECLSPLQTKPSYQSHTVERSQSPGSHGQPAIGHGYHPGTAQRPGNHSSAQTRFQSPVHHGGFDEGQTASQGSYQPSPQTGFQFPAHSQSSGIHQTGFGEGQVASQPGYHATNQISAHSPRVHRTGYQANAQIGSQPPITHQTGFGEDQDAVQAGYQNSAHISADSPVVHQTGFGEGGVVRQPGFDGGRIANQPALQGQEEFETRQFRFSEYAAQEGAQFDEKVPLSPSHNEPTKSPVRKCWEVNPPVENPVFAVPSPEEGQEEDDDMNQYEDPGDDQQQNKKGVALFIGNQAQKPEEGLTPEQQKKKDRFLKNRLKKLEEEKVRKDAENEKKKIREQKQKELEEQKRLEEEQRRDEQQRLQQQRRLKPQGSMGSSGESIHHHDEPSTFNDFSGPRCYVKPTGKSNRKLIINAISHVCLSGTVNKDNKDKCLQAIADTPGFNFIVLFKDGLKFRGLYILNPETEQAFKIFGIGPKVITSKMVDCVYKYSSGGKEFSKIPSKSLSISVDGVAILKSYWQSNKPVVASKTQSNLKRPPRPPQR